MLKKFGLFCLTMTTSFTMVSCRNGLDMNAGLSSFMPAKVIKDAPQKKDPAASFTHAAKKAQQNVGIASWYGEDFHGRKTASGEIFDMHDMTAAHPKLPLGSMVRVTNLENGKDAILRITDRGPYAGGRILDVSKSAAGCLGFIDSGMTRVRIDVLKGKDLRLAEAKHAKEERARDMIEKAVRTSAPAADSHTQVADSTAAAQRNELLSPQIKF